MKHDTVLLDVEALGKNIKASVEERKDGIFLSCLWDCTKEFENDRIVVEFETYSAALAHMYKELFLIAKMSLGE